MVELALPGPLPQRLLQNARVVASRADVLPLLPKRKVFAEIGVAAGGFTRAILDECDVEKFIAIDIFTLHEFPAWTPRFNGLTHEEYFIDQFHNEINVGKMTIMKGMSVDCLRKLADRSVDIFYVDAGHDYDSVSGELSIIKNKTKEEGLIILNDYILYDHMQQTSYGVIHATHEFMIRENWEMLYFALNPAMFCDVVIRKVL